MKPEVTVLITVYNGLPFLREAIESVLVQSFRDFELLIVDDGSTDGSVEAVMSYSDPRIRLLRNSANIGQNASLNIGLREARGSLIVRLDQDDVCLPDRIARQTSFLSNNPEIAVVGTWAFSIDEHSRKRTQWRWRVPDFGRFLGLLLLGRCALLHPAVAYRRQTILELGGYNNAFRIAADYALWIDLVLAGHRAAVIPEQLMMYRVHQMQQSASKAHAHWQDTVRAHEKLVAAFFPGKDDVAVLASVLRLESTVWKQASSQKEIAGVLESVRELLDHASEVLPLSSRENANMQRTVYRWLGPGVKLAGRLKSFPPAVFYPAVMALSPLLAPGIRPAVTQVLETMRILRTRVRFAFK